MDSDQESTTNCYTMNCLAYCAYITVIISDTALGRPVEEKSRDHVKHWENPCSGSGQDDPVEANGSASGEFGLFDDFFDDTKPVSLDAYIEEMIVRCTETEDLANDLKEEIANKSIQSQTVIQMLNETHLPGFLPTVRKPLESLDEMKHILPLHLADIQTASIFLYQFLAEEEDGNFTEKMTRLSDHLSGLLCLLEEILHSQSVNFQQIKTEDVTSQIPDKISTANKATRAYVFIRDLSEALMDKKMIYSEIKSKWSERSDGN